MSTPPACLLVPALLALRGEGPLPHPLVLTPPPELSGLARPAPPDAKALYGGRMANHVDSENFTVAWNQGQGSQAAAQLASEALEQAWEALLLDQGWPAPVSSDRYLLWVILDRSLSGTGLTVPYQTGEFPGGYPVIYLNPDYANDTNFFRSLAAHEFMHAIQFAMRDYYLGDEETWYWEASAEWAAELALPEVDAYGYQSRWYSERPELRYSSVEAAHPYGMFVLNAWLDEHVGEGTMLAVWTHATGRDGEDWDGLLAEALGEPRERIWGGFTRAMGEGALREWALYMPPVRVGALVDGASGELDALGTHYYEVQDELTVSATGEVWLSGPHDEGEEVWLEAGDVLAVTGLADGPTPYTLEILPMPSDSDPAVDTDGPTDPKPSQPATCAAAPGAATGPAWLVALLALARSGYLARAASMASRRASASKRLLA